MKAKIGCLILGLFLLASAAQADANDRFHGGSYDGWCSNAMSEYARILLEGTIIRIF